MLESLSELAWLDDGKATPHNPPLQHISQTIV
jgi:hypothetical protein